MIEVVDFPARQDNSTHNIEVEQALLGAILVNNDAAAKVSGFLCAEHFYDALHGRIYNACLRLIESNDLASAISLKPYFDGDDALKQVGGMRYLAKLASHAVTIYNADSFGRQIYDLWLLRRVAEIGADAARCGMTSDLPAPALVADLINRLSDLEPAYHGGAVLMDAAVDEALAYIDAAQRGKLKGVTTGLPSLDRALTGGLHASDLIILAGRPGMGKTSLACKIVHAAGNSGVPVLFFSLEMSRAQITSRLLSSVSGLSNDELRSPDGLQDGAEERLNRAAAAVKPIPVYIDDRPDKTVETIRADARRMVKRHKIGLVVVDHLGKIKSTNDRAMKVHQIEHITGQLKNMAKELDIPVLALCQLNRQLEQREDKRPTLSDLRDGGSIEQDADQVLFLYREEYYKRRAEPKNDAEKADWWAEMQKIKGMAEVRIAKNRHGAERTVDLYFSSHCMRFGELER